VTTSNQQSHDSTGSTFRPTRRELLPLAGAAAALVALAPAALASAEAARSRAGSRFVYVGTYTAPNTAPGGVRPSTALGIYVFKMDGRNGGLTPVQIVKDIPNPSWLTLDAGMRVLYASSEVSTWKGTPNSGGATAYAVNHANGRLTLLNDQPTLGAIPASLLVDPSGHYLLIDNYIGANFVVRRILADGRIGAATDVFPVSGSGPNAARQEAPHPHQILFDPAGKFVFGPDLGTDKIWIWTLDLATGKLVPNALPYAQVASGSGPRHMAFHPTAPFVYVIDELVASITAFSYDSTRGTLTWIQTVSTLPPDFTGPRSCAEIRVHPNGKFVYGSNRGHDSIVGFEIDQTSGKLSLIGWTPTQGSIPRTFNIDPSGTLLLAANQNGDSIVPFRVDLNTGQLTPTGRVTATPTPVCIVFGPTLPDGDED
jgi:6-phosphogluconolactonase